MSSNNPKTLNQLEAYFIQRIEKGKTKLISLANRYSSERINPKKPIKKNYAPSAF